MKFDVFISKCLAIAIVFFTSTSIAMANITERDISVISRIITLLENAPTGVVEIATIKNDQASNVSLFTSLVEKNPGYINITLKPVLVRYEDLESMSAKILIIPEDVSEAHLRQIFEVAKRKKILTISTSTACVNTKTCAISIVTSPEVNITVSNSAAKETGVNFSSTFRILIKEEE